MRGEGAPSPIYEGEDSVIAYVLSGPGKKYTVPLPKVNEPKKAILETYTKEHSAEYQSQALIDLARSLNKRIKNISDINKITIETSHHTHYVIGTGANDPQKMDPYASRETLDHSIMYIFAVGKTLIIVHHDLSNAKEYFDQIILLNMRLIAYGDVNKTFTKDLLQKTYGGRLTVFTEIADQSAKDFHNEPEHKIK